MKPITMTLMTLFLACSLMAQQPPGPRGPVGRADELKAALGLTDTQVQQLFQLLKDRAEGNRTVMTQIGQKEAALRDTLKAGGATAATVGQLVLDIDALRKQLQENDTHLGDSARGLLSAAQLAQLKVLEDAAKLEPAIRQAINLNLIAGAAPGPGRGPAGIGGPSGQGGPGGMRGAGMMIRRNNPNQQ